MYITERLGFFILDILSVRNSRFVGATPCPSSQGLEVPPKRNFYFSTFIYVNSTRFFRFGGD